MRIRGVLFDFIGTIVMEKDPSTINNCFAHAFNDHGVPVSNEFIKANRGKDKKEVITEALQQYNLPAKLAGQITITLSKHIEANLGNFYENDGAKETIRYLKEKGMVIGTGSGLPRDTFEKIFNHLEWETIGFDYIGIAEEIGKGRPDPAMILDMLKKCKLDNNAFLKVGDTVADIQEGKNASVFTAVILSGTQDEKDLLKQQPDIVIRALKELKEII
jgi:HAD superfamily hydrolase (TIGR01549 family)